LTHTYQARPPADQRAPITPIDVVAYLANLGRPADQIGESVCGYQPGFA
jgi:hypothetical protein